MSPAADPGAPYVRLAVVGLISRTNQRGVTAAAREGAACDGAAEGPAAAPGARWLLLHRVHPFDAWDPPGGRMEVGEDLVAGVRREVQEETGLTVEVAGPCYAFLTFYQGERLLAVSMACRPLSDPDAVRLEPGGAVGWRWATEDEWETLAGGGFSSWDPGDVKKATNAVGALWEAVQG